MSDAVFNGALLTAVYALFVRRFEGGFVLRLVALITIATIVMVPIAYLSVRTSWTDAMFQSMRLASFTLFLHIPIALLIVAYRGPRRVIPGATAGILVAIAVDAFLYEPTALEVTVVEHRSAEIEKPLSIALVADLQTDDPGPYERRVLERVAERTPDLVLFAGDYVHAHDHAGYARASKELRLLLESVDLHAPLGLYAVRGNVDAPANWRQIFEGTGIKTVETSTTIELDGVHLMALSFADSFDVDLDLDVPDGFVVAVGHGPDYALSGLAADLSLAGHTHGGQVRVPFIGPILTLSKVPRTWASGVTRIDDTRTLIVSRGIGMERGDAPRLRFMCRPQLVFVDVVPR